MSYDVAVRPRHHIEKGHVVVRKGHVISVPDQCMKQMSHWHLSASPVSCETLRENLVKVKIEQGRSHD